MKKNCYLCPKKAECYTESGLKALKRYQLSECGDDTAPVVIEVNNGRRLHLTLDADGLHVEHVDERGNIDQRTRLDAGELVTVLNWVEHQRNNDNPGLLF